MSLKSLLNCNKNSAGNAFCLMRGAPLDSSKGLLIILIVAGHNALFKSEYPLAQLFYLFHVQIFLLLGVILNSSSFSCVFVRDRAFRYLTPYVVFTIFYSCIFIFASNVSVGAQVELTSKALLSGNFHFLNDAAGLRLLWFLPCLFALIVIHSVYLKCSGLGRGLMLVTCLFIMAYVDDIDSSINFYGWIGACYYFPFALLIKKILILRVDLPKWLIFMAPIVFILAFYLMTYFCGAISPGYPKLFGFRDGVEFWIYLLFFPVLVLSFLVSSLLYQSRVLVSLGRMSLFIYLLHQPIQVVLTGVLLNVGLFNRSISGILVILLTLVFSWIFSFLIFKLQKLRQLIAPRNFNDFQEALGLK